MSLLTFITVVLLVPVQTAADGGEFTIPRYIDCFECDSRLDPFCEDPFNSTDSESLQNTRKCDSDCLKWEREIEPGNPTSDWYVLRTCKSAVRIEMYLSSDMCISESRPGSGHMCTCHTDRCNTATTQTQSAAIYFTLLLLSYLTLYVIT